MVNAVRDSVMLQNIWEQPEVVAECLGIKLPIPDSVLAAERIVLLGCGSSHHAALVAKHWFESLAQLSTEVIDAAAWTDRPPWNVVNSNFNDASKTILIALSQSGQTKDLLDAIGQIKSANSEMIIVTIANVADSPLGKLADVAIVTPAGVELAVAATKSFIAQLTILARLAVSLAEARSALSPTQILTLQSDLGLLPIAMVHTLHQSRKQTVGEGLALNWMNRESLILLGSKIQQPIAREGALKFKETCYVHAEGFEMGDFCHGPMAILNPGFPIIALMPDEKMRSQLDRFRSFGAYVIGIGRIAGRTAFAADDGNDVFLSGLDEVLEVEPIANWLMPFVTLVPLQLLAYDWAKVKGLEVDRPRYLTKFIG